MTLDLGGRVEALAGLMAGARHLVVFTGAGISTASGLPDFRGPEGVWTRQARGLPAARFDWSATKPNAGHFAIAELQGLGKLAFLISQNVDNLHLKSGIRPELLAELHGNIMKVRCEGCQFLMDNLGDLTKCPLCGGRLESSVVDFGMSLPRKELADAYEHSHLSDVFAVVGSSLVVRPAADMPEVALECGAELVIINQGETPLDRRARLLFGEPISDVLPRAVERLKRMLGRG